MELGNMLLSSACILALIIGFAGAQRPVSVRFAGGVTSNFGVVEVTMTDGTVGRICDTGFDNNGASVVCAMMGYRGISGFKITTTPVTTGDTTARMAVIGCPDFSATSTTTWNLDTACRYVVGVTIPASCSSRTSDVAVICSGALTPAPVATGSTATPNMATVAPTVCNSSVTNLRLEPGPDEGIVVIRNGTSGATNFGTVCATDFSVNEATMICRMLCQNATTNAIGVTGKYLNVSSPYPVMLSGLTCPAGATSTNDCRHNGWGVASTGCSSVTAVTVRCIPLILTPPSVPHPTAFCRDYHALVYFSITDVSSSALLSLYGAYSTATCNFTVDQNATAVWASIPYIGCNSVQTSNATHVIYTASLYKNVTMVDGVYIDSPYVIPVSCAIPKVGAVSAALLPDARTVTPITGGDAYSSEVRLFQTYSTGAFQTNINPGDSLIVGSKIYARVQLTSPLSVRLTVRACWASDRSDGSGSRYYMLQAKCATTGNSVFRVDAKTVGINFVVISFSGTPRTQVYVFCDVIICAESETNESCQQVCGTSLRRRRRAADKVAGAGEELPHNGPFQMVQARETSAATRVATSTAAIAVAAAFATATLLMQ